jgi:hypothetical protein
LDETIVRAAIHPGIGIARVGNSVDEYFFGPEVCGPQPVPDGGYKDAKGAVKRQAARFRIYGFNAAGRIVGEITATTAEIRVRWIFRRPRRSRAAIPISPARRGIS